MSLPAHLPAHTAFLTGFSFSFYLGTCVTSLPQPPPAPNRPVQGLRLLSPLPHLEFHREGGAPAPDRSHRRPEVPPPQAPEWSRSGVALPAQPESQADTQHWESFMST